jgi:hypothetical protein
MVHGMEVEWPGIMLLVKYDKTIETSVIDRENSFDLYFSNYPNPFNPYTTIQYSLDRETVVILQIRDSLGRRVKELVHGIRQSGEQSVTWFGDNDNGMSVSSGIYVAKLSTPYFAKTRKLLLLR